MSESYYFGQGEFEVAEWLANGTLGPYLWVGDVSELSGAFSQTAVNHRESFSGRKGKVREFFTELGIDWSATIHQLDVDNVAKFTLGKVSSTAPGTVTGEPLPTGLQAGDVVVLDHPNVSDLVLTDSLTPTPATIDPSHYSYDLYGDVKILSLPTGPAPTQPLKAAYSYGAYKQAAFLAGERKTYALRYKGINLAENGQRCMVEVYKVSAGLIQTLSLITSGNQLAGAPVTFGSLLDTSKPVDGVMGQYGRYVVLEAA